MQGSDLNDRLVAAAHDGDPAGVRLLAPAIDAADATASAPAMQVQALAALQPAVAGEGLWVALGPTPEPGLPGELLRLLRVAGYEVQGFADRAVLLAAWLPGVTSLVLVEYSRTRFSVSLAARDAQSAALSRHVPLPGGEQGLHDAWLRLAATTLVQQTRFDPLHDLRHEAALRAQVPLLAASAQRDGQASCELATDSGAGPGAVTLALTRDQLAAAARPVLAPLAAALQALSAAHGDALLLVTDSLLELPGIDAVLAAARFARAGRIADDLPARAASLLAPSGAGAGGGVPWQTRLPVLGGSAPADALQPLARDTGNEQVMATHVVYRGRVLPITAEGLVIGREPGPAPALRLPDGLAGLSRRHCTLRRDAGRTQVIDHSSHGTFLDGARVRGRALLPAGGVLKVGDPGIELPLVAIGAE